MDMRTQAITNAENMDTCGLCQLFQIGPRGCQGRPKSVQGGTPRGCGNKSRKKRAIGRQCHARFQNGSQQLKVSRIPSNSFNVVSHHVLDVFSKDVSTHLDQFYHHLYDLFGFIRKSFLNETICVNVQKK